MTRLKAFALHFLISLLVFSLFIFVLLNLWFPEPFFSASGGIQGLKLVTLVDVVLGPLMTLVVFNPQKPKTELKRDLSIIFILQITALIWGVHTVYQQKPVAVVYFEDSLVTVPRKELLDGNPSSPQLQEIINNPGGFYYIEKPTTPEGMKKLLDRVVTSKAPPHHQVDLYRDFENFFPLISKNSLDIEEIITQNPEMREQLAEKLGKDFENRDQYIYIPIKSKYRNIILIFTSSGTQKGYILAPYKK